MKIDVNYKFKNIEGVVQREMIIDEDDDGNPKRDREGIPILKLGKPFTLRSACTNVLVNPPVDVDPKTGREKEVKAEDKLKWADLAMRIYKSNSLIELAPEEIVLLKRFINKRYKNTLTVQQAHAVLDPTSVPVKETLTAETKKP